MDLVIEIYAMTKHFPKEEMYALTTQIRRAALSVSSNIAEGAAGRTPKQFTNYLSNSLGSFNEIDTQLEIAFRLGYIDTDKYKHLHKRLDECIAISYGLRKSLRNSKR